jgi:hypothetical protein
MKRGDILYPQAFTLAAIIHRLGGCASVQQIYAVANAAPGGPGPELKSYHQILRHLEKRGYLRRHKDEDLPVGRRVQWALTQPYGAQMLILTKTYYMYAMQFLAEGTH